MKYLRAELEIVELDLADAIRTSLIEGENKDPSELPTIPGGDF